MNELDPWVIRDKHGRMVWMGTHKECLLQMHMVRASGMDGWFTMKQERIVAHEEVRDGTQVDSD